MSAANKLDMTKKVPALQSGANMQGKIWVNGTSYTTAQEAYDAAHTLQQSLGGTNIVVMEVGVDVDNTFSFISLTTWNQYVHVVGLSAEASLISSIEPSSGPNTITVSNVTIGAINAFGAVTVVGNQAVIGTIDTGGFNVAVSGSDVRVTGTINTEGANAGDITISDGVQTSTLDAYGTTTGGDVTVGNNCSVGAIDAFSDTAGGAVVIGDDSVAGNIAVYGDATTGGTITTGARSRVGNLDTHGATAGGSITIGEKAKAGTITTEGQGTTGGAVTINSGASVGTVTTLGATSAGNVTIGDDCRVGLVTMNGTANDGGILSVGDRNEIGNIIGSGEDSKNVTIGDDNRIGDMDFTATETHGIWIIGDRNEIGDIEAQGDRTGGSGTSSFVMGDDNKITGVNFQANDGNLSTFTMGDRNEVNSDIEHHSFQGQNEGFTMGNYNKVSGNINNSRDNGTSPFVMGDHCSCVLLYNRVFQGGSATGAGQPVTVGKFCNVNSILNYGSTSGGDVTVGKGSSVGAIETWCEAVLGTGGDVTLNEVSCGIIKMTDGAGNSIPGKIEAYNTHFQDATIDSLLGTSILHGCRIEGNILEVYSNGAQLLFTTIIPDGADKSIVASAAKTVVVANYAHLNGFHANVTASEGTPLVLTAFTQLSGLS